MSEIAPFRLESFEEEARRLMEASRAKAAEILRAALAEAARLREEASREGREAGLAEGRAEGLQAGRAEGGAEERRRIAAETAGLQDLLRGVARAVGDKRAELTALAERDLVGLSIAIAEKVVKAEVRKGVPVAAANVRHAIELVARRQEVRVVVHPDDLSMVEAYLPALRHEFADLGGLDLEAGDGVTRGGCVVVTKEGAVDADLDTQLDEIYRELLG